jgi:hypothetical protein
LEQLCITVRAHGDPRSYEQVLSLIADRYGNGLYQQVHEGEPADVEVRISRPEAEPVCILDAFRHEALRWKLIAELGQSRVDFCLLTEDRIAEDLTVLLRYRIVPEAQIQLFKKFLDDIPALLSDCFPITFPGSTLEVRLGKIRIIPPADATQGGAISTRWFVRAHLTLVDHRDERVIDSGWFWLCNFFGPRDDGRINEPGQKRQRVFDEVASRFPHSIRTWLKTTIPANLAAQASNRVSIRDLFEFED